MKIFKTIGCSILFSISVTANAELIPIPLIDLSLHFAADISNDSELRNQDGLYDAEKDKLMRYGFTLSHSFPFIPNIKIESSTSATKDVDAQYSSNYSFNDLTFFYSLGILFIDADFGITKRGYEGDLQSISSSSVTDILDDSSTLGYASVKATIPFIDVIVTATTYTPLSKSDILTDQEVTFGYSPGFDVGLHLGARQTQIQKGNLFTDPSTNSESKDTVYFVKITLDLL